MSFLRSIGHDLVEKRLWPVAVVLVLALLAVPVLLGRSGGDAPAPAASGPIAAAPSSPSAAAAAAEVSVAGAAPATSDRPGDLRDPFEPQRGSKAGVEDPGPAVAAAKDDATAASSAGAAGAAAGASGTSGASGGSGGSGASASSGSDATPPPAATTPDDAVEAATTTPVPAVTLRTMRVDLRFGDAEALALPKLRDDVARLTAMPTTKEAPVVYLGVLEDRRTAAFLLPEGATAEGEGRCRPSVRACTTIELEPGDTQYIDVPPASGEGVARQFTLTVAHVREAKATSLAAARAAHRRRSAAGSKLVRDAVRNKAAGLDRYAFDYDEGVLVRRAAATAATAK